MYYNVSIISGSVTSPFSVSELSDHLRLNGSGECPLLSGYSLAATNLFEQRTGLFLSPRIVNQYWASPITIEYLQRGPVTAISGVLSDGSPVSHTSFIYSSPAYVQLESPLTTGVNLVQYTAGYASGQVPETIKLGIKLLAASYYSNRETLSASALNQLPFGFESIVDWYKTGVRQCR